jgi:hypothetical protein
MGEACKHDKVCEAQPAEAVAVNRAIDRVGTVPGRRIDLPTAPRGTPYYALRTSNPDAPVIIYRKMRDDEDGDWLVVSLMTPAQYRQQQEVEQSGYSTTPAVRQEVKVAADTAATAAVRAFPGGVATQPGAISTRTSTDKRS